MVVKPLKQSSTLFFVNIIFSFLRNIKEVLFGILCFHIFVFLDYSYFPPFGFTRWGHFEFEAIICMIPAAIIIMIPAAIIIMMQVAIILMIPRHH